MDSFERYLISSYRFLNYRFRSEKEVRDNLKKKKASPEIIDAVLIKLKAQKFVNDENFAEIWVRSRVETKPRSKHVLSYELKNKGIDKIIIEKTIALFFPNKSDEVEQAKHLIQLKLRRYSGMEKEELYQKLGGLLARRGFSWEVSKKAIDSLFIKQE